MCLCVCMYMYVHVHTQRHSSGPLSRLSLHPEQGSSRSCTRQVHTLRKRKARFRPQPRGGAWSPPTLGYGLESLELGQDLQPTSPHSLPPGPLWEDSPEKTPEKGHVDEGREEAEVEERGGVHTAEGGGQRGPVRASLGGTSPAGVFLSQLPQPPYQSPSMMSAQSSALPSPCSRLSNARMPAYT